VLSCCAQAPRSGAASPRARGEGRGAGAPVRGGGSTLGRGGDGRAAPIKFPLWGRLAELLGEVRENHVPPFLVRKLLTQVVAFVNVQPFNRWGSHPFAHTPWPMLDGPHPSRNTPWPTPHGLKKLTLQSPCHLLQSALLVWHRVRFAHLLHRFLTG